MKDIAELKCFLTCRLEIAKSFLKQEVKPGSASESEQWVIQGRMLEIEKLLERLAEVNDDCLEESHS